MIYQDTAEKILKRAYLVYHNFWRAIAAEGVICRPIA